MAEDPQTRTADATPAVLGEYRIIRPLGGGGMGQLVEAEDPRLGRRVAIKVMRSELASSPAARERFVREARAAAAIRHDHVVPVYQVGECDQTPYLVMPLLAGESLAERLDRGALPSAEVVRVAREAALGLAAAHAAGLVHRDVKPGNLFLEAPHGRVIVLDFGLARAADGADGLTRPGSVLGTPGYLSPEQANGLAVDARSDLFGLGASLYHAATGERPFRGDTFTALLRAVVEHDPPPPCAVNPAVPRALSDLIMRLLAKNPAARPPSAEAVAEEAARLFTAPSTTVWDGCARPAPPSPSSSGGARRQMQIGCTVTVSLCLMVGLASTFWLRPAAQPHARDQRGNSPLPGMPASAGPPERDAAVAGWKADDTAGRQVIGDTRYSRRLTRTVAGEDLVAVLLYKVNPGDPDAPYYMLKNKVTNRVFAQIMGDALKSQTVTVAHLNENGVACPTGDWQSGAVVGERKFGVTGKQAGVPVVRVTLPEAALAARQLGGRLPTFLEWKHAAGANGGDSRYGPAGPPLVVPPELVNSDEPDKEAAWKREELRKRNLALGRTDGPQPIDTVTTDLSRPWGIHQLVSNGPEWLGEDVGTGQSIDPDGKILSGKKRALVIGCGPNEFRITSFSDPKPRVQEWHEVDNEPSFRVVLPTPRK